MFMDGILRFEKLDTAYINLGALVRYLRGQSFVGRMHVSLEQYEADLFFRGSEPPVASEKDLVSGRGSEGEGVIERLMIRAREPGGTITLHAPTEEKSDTHEDHTEPEAEIAPDATASQASDWDRILTASGALIAAVERAIASTGKVFDDVFRQARTSLGDDYPFLDPTLHSFDYSGGTVDMRSNTAMNTYVSGLSECLRRTVNQVAGNRINERFRERVAVEIASLARTQPEALAAFAPHLDRIAGTRVL